ncbi:DNA primase [Botrimarina mediterranea]|uniref:DNA primase n=1 Tax=Botrimarina mediterranea TaxID=2528022 RepID=A0A518K6K2_9BACT|nr:DNA primase [Botrimarina mediterranea]QDV73414.1 DNA primase [Botrimarina mediterranea]QDV77931.1 DNA primase [Planctomycetes bacterium K2D]
MSFAGADDAKERVRQATDIVDLVGSYLQLRRQGRGYVGLCPWHDDSKPSFQVNPDRQSFKCWVCDIGGDVFSFLMKMDGLEFREALEQLADRAGIELRPAQPGQRIEPGSPGDKKTLLAAMAWAVERYHHCLLEAQQAEPARAYLAERGVSAEAIQRFRIGFAPQGWDWLLKQGPGAGYSPAVLERVNLIASRSSGDGYYDQFRGRVLFPIRDVRGRPVAIGGRIIPQLAEAEARPDYKPAKYVNSSETPIYSKSHTLYALDLAKEGSSQLSELVVVEGYTDVIACHQAGVTNVVACCGTAMGEGHLKLVRRFTDRLVLVLDGDEAGRRRASELLELFIASPIDLRILTLPGRLDPCDFVASHGSDKFADLVAQAPDALEHKLQSVTNGMVLSADNTHAATRAAEQMLATLARTRPLLGEAPSAFFLREQSIVGRLSRRLRLPEESLRKRLSELRQSADSKPLVAARVEAIEDAAPRRVRATELPSWEREAIELMLLGDDFAQKLTQDLDEVDFHGAARELFVAFRDAALAGEATYEHLMSIIEDEPLKMLLIEIDELGSGRTTSDPVKRLNDLLLIRQRRHEGAARGEQISALRSGELCESEADQAVAALFASRKRHETGSPSTEG